MQLLLLSSPAVAQQGGLRENGQRRFLLVEYYASPIARDEKSVSV